MSIGELRPNSPEERSRSGLQAGVPFILVTVFLDVLGIGIIVPVLPELVMRVTRGSATDQPIAYGLLFSAYALMQFVFAPVLGGLSDRIGRRPILLVSTAGLAVDFLLTYFASSLGMLFVARILSGITSANLTTANAYIADVTQPDNRARNFGLVGAMVGLGFILGPALGGLFGARDPRLPFLLAAGLCFLNFVYGLWVLPESLPSELRDRVSRLRLNPFASIASIGRFPSVATLAGTLVCVSVAQQAVQSVWVLYTTLRFGWTALDNGLCLTAAGIVTAVVQGGLVGFAVKRVGETRALLFGLALGIISQVLYGLSTQGWMVYGVMLVGAMGGIAGPAAQALVSRSVPGAEQGSVQGALSSLMSLCAIVAPVMATSLFARFSSRGSAYYVPGISFFVSAVILVVGSVAALRYSRSRGAAVGDGFGGA